MNGHSFPPGDDIFLTQKRQVYHRRYVIKKRWYLESLQTLFKWKIGITRVAFNNPATATASHICIFHDISDLEKELGTQLSLYVKIQPAIMKNKSKFPFKHNLGWRLLLLNNAYISTKEKSFKVKY